jgi:hypothetical protein
MSKLTEKQKIEAAEKNLERITAWISASDTKTGIVLAFQGGMVAFLSTKGKEVADIFHVNGLASETSVLAVLLLMFTIFLLWSVCTAFKALYPDTKLREPSPFFFGSIAVMGQEKYKQTMQLLTEEKMEEELNNQVHINSEIASNKFKNVRVSIKALLAASIFWLLILILLPTLSLKGKDYCRAGSRLFSTNSPSSHRQKCGFRREKLLHFPDFKRAYIVP